MYFMRIKDKIYNALVRKNGRVRYEYERYVSEHMEEHRLHRLRHLRLLLKLNWFYRVKKGNTPYLYWDVPMDPALAKKPAPEKPAPNAAQKANPARKPKPAAAQTKVKMPYNGVESACGHRLKPQFLAKRAMSYDVISFDIFDTLILRKLSDPKAVFLILADKLGIPQFAKIRVETEQTLRKKLELECGHREITIFEIYEQISQKTGLDVLKGVETEFETELELCVANPYMKYVYDMLADAGKTIVITSDFYYPEEYIRRLLDANGYPTYEKLYVSCDHRKSKADQQLYGLLLDEYPDKKIYHIGDNVTSDVKQAEAMGIHGFWYKGVNQIGMPYRADGMSGLIGSAYSGIINNYLHHGLEKLTIAEEYGFIYGGLYILGYCNYIKKLVQEKRIENCKCKLDT